MLNQAETDLPHVASTDAESDLQIRRIPANRELVSQHLVYVTAGEVTAIVARAVDRVEDHWEVRHYVDLELDTVVERAETLEQIAAVATEAAAMLRRVDGTRSD